MSLKDNPLRAEYKAHIEKQITSGLSAKKYCELNNLVEHKLSYYRTYSLKTKKTKADKAFAKVKIKPPNIEKPLNKIDPAWLAEFLNRLLVAK